MISKLAFTPTGRSRGHRPWHGKFFEQDYRGLNKGEEAGTIGHHYDLSDYDVVGIHPWRTNYEPGYPTSSKRLTYHRPSKRASALKRNCTIIQTTAFGTSNSRRHACRRATRSEGNALLVVSEARAFMRKRRILGNESGRACRAGVIRSCHGHSRLQCRQGSILRPTRNQSSTNTFGALTCQYLVALRTSTVMTANPVFAQPVRH